MYTGLTGSLKICDDSELWSSGEDSLVTVAYISGFSVEDTSEVIEVSKVGQVHKDAYTGFQSWSASANGVASFERDGQIKLFKAKHSGQKVLLQLYLRDRQFADDENRETYFQGEGYIESLSTALSAEGTANISISIKGTGQLDLFVRDADGIVNVKTGKEQQVQEMFFKMWVDGDGYLNVKPDEENRFRFAWCKEAAEDGKVLKVSVGRRRG